MKREAHLLRVMALCDHLGHSGGRVHGGTTYYLNTFTALVRAGVDLTVCFMGRYHAAAAALKRGGVDPIFLNRARWNPAAMLDVLTLARRRRVQIMHLASMKSHVMGPVIARMIGARAMIHIHDANRLPAALRVVQRRLSPWIDAGLAISRPICDHMIEEYAIAPERALVVPNGIDLRRFDDVPADARQRVRRELGLADDQPVISVIGRLIPEKGQGDLISAMRLVLEAFPHTALLVVGAGPARSHYERLAAQLGVAGAVRFTGQRDDVPDLLAASDLVAIPSLVAEGFGFAALEAIASGRPVVAYDSGALPDIVIHGQTGLLVERGSVEGLASALRRLLGEGRLARRLADGGWRHARQYAVDHHVKRLIDIYQRCLERGAPIAEALPWT